MIVNISFLQQTYDRVPKPNESHLHLMNTLGCPISVRVSNAEGIYSQHLEMETRCVRVK